MNKSQSFNWNLVEIFQNLKKCTEKNSVDGFDINSNC